MCTHVQPMYTKLILIFITTMSSYIIRQALLEITNACHALCYEIMHNLVVQYMDAQHYHLCWWEIEP